VTPISLGIFASANLSAGATSYESIASTLVGSGGSANIDFTSITGTYSHLQLRYYIPSLPSAADAISIRLGNGSIDTNANYSYHGLYGYSGGAKGSLGGTDTTQVELHFVPAGNTTPFNGVVDILDYANTNKYKTVRSLSGHDANNTSTNLGQIWFNSGSWRNTSAITHLRFFYTSGGNFPQYTRVSLYGIKSA
jgi:hypothetical protein